MKNIKDVTGTPGVYGVYGIYLKDGTLLYVGQTQRNVTIRWNEHKSRLLKGTHENKTLQKYFINNNLSIDDLEFKLLHQTKCKSKFNLETAETIIILLEKPLCNKPAIRVGRCWKVYNDNPIVCREILKYL